MWLTISRWVAGIYVKGRDLSLSSGFKFLNCIGKAPLKSKSYRFIH